MIKKLNKISLDFNLAWMFVKDNLEGGNELSKALLEEIDVKNGHFFTLMPDDANLQRLYEFKTGGILPQNPELVGKNGSTYSFIPNLVEELAHLIQYKIQNNPKLWAFFEDVSWGPSFEHFGVLLSHVRIYGNQVYYALGMGDLEIPKIVEAIANTNAFWHSVAVLTETDVGRFDRELTLEQFAEIARQTELLIIGAYDAEGYVFWEKNKS